MVQGPVRFGVDNNGKIIQVAEFGQPDLIEHTAETSWLLLLLLWWLVGWSVVFGEVKTKSHLLLSIASNQATVAIGRFAVKFTIRVAVIIV